MLTIMPDFSRKPSSATDVCVAFELGFTFGIVVLFAGREFAAPIVSLGLFKRCEKGREVREFKSYNG